LGAAATFQETEGIDAVESHGGEFFAEGGDGGSGELVGGLFGDTKGCADLAVGFAVTDAFGDFAEAVKSPLSGSKRRAALARASCAASSISAW
jgi:hypothetical protein